MVQHLLISPVDSIRIMGAQHSNQGMPARRTDPRSKGPDPCRIYGAVILAMLAFLVPATGEADLRKASATQKQQYSCARRHIWVPRAVKYWSRAPYQSARASQQTTLEALEAIRGVRWDKYHPGSEEITLTPHGGTVTMSVRRLSPPNQPYKPEGIIKVLQRAVDVHNTALAQLLKGRGNLTFIMQTEDFPIIWKTEKRKLPAFSMCTGKDSTDYPVPDFTFEVYPEAGYTNTSWWALRELLVTKGRMLQWERRTRAAHMRHFAGVGYRETLVPVLSELQANGSMVLTVPLDVADTGFAVSNETNFMHLDEWCKFTHAIHSAGLTYSAALKYKLACGSVVLLFESHYREFFYRALRPLRHMISAPEGTRQELLTSLLPLMGEAIATAENTAGGAHVRPAMSIEAQRFAMQVLSKEALSCYWLHIITAYAELYYATNNTQIPAGPTWF